MSSTIKDISENLGRVFRYILPGVVILGLAYLSNRSWFKDIKLDNWWDLLALAMATLVIGNTWFVFHRFGVQQLIDLVFYELGFKGPAVDKMGHRERYVDGVARFVVESHKISPEEPIRQHISLRASSMHLMYITSEALFVFTCLPGSSFRAYKCWFISLSIVGFVFSWWQNNITRRIDWYSIEQNLQPLQTKDHPENKGEAS